MSLARISLTLYRHFSLSFIASARSSGLHPVSSHSCWMYVRAAFARPYVGVHRSISLMSSSLLLQQCPGSSNLDSFLDGRYRITINSTHLHKLPLYSTHLYKQLYSTHLYIAASLEKLASQRSRLLLKNAWAACGLVHYKTWANEYSKEDRWPYCWCLVGCCRQDLFNIARSILVQLTSTSELS